MPEKQEVLDSITDKSYNAKEVKCLVNSVKTSGGEDKTVNNHPSKVKIGDVYITQCGVKSRPVVIISVKEKEGLTIGVPLTTTNNEMAIGSFVSRFFGEGYFSKSILSAPEEVVIKNFAGILENKQAIVNIKKELRKYFRNVL